MLQNYIAQKYKKMDKKGLCIDYFATMEIPTCSR